MFSFTRCFRKTKKNNWITEKKQAENLGALKTNTQKLRIEDVIIY